MDKYIELYNSFLSSSFGTHKNKKGADMYEINGIRKRKDLKREVKR